MGKHIVGMTSEGIKKKIIIIIHESFFGYLLLKGKSLNPAYPWEVCEVKTHKQWRVLIFHNKKITNEKEVLATDCLFFFQSISPVHLLLELGHILGRSIKAELQSC